MATLPPENREKPHEREVVTRHKCAERSVATSEVFYDSRILRWQNRYSTPTLGIFIFIIISLIRIGMFGI
jgi:hypothetical protein